MEPSSSSGIHGASKACVRWIRRTTRVGASSRNSCRELVALLDPYILDMGPDSIAANAGCPTFGTAETLWPLVARSGRAPSRTFSR